MRFLFRAGAFWLRSGFSAGGPGFWLSCLACCCSGRLWGAGFARLVSSGCPGRSGGPLLLLLVFWPAGFGFLPFLRLGFVVFGGSPPFLQCPLFPAQYAQQKPPSHPVAQYFAIRYRSAPCGRSYVTARHWGAAIASVLHSTPHLTHNRPTRRPRGLLSCLTSPRRLKPSHSHQHNAHPNPRGRSHCLRGRSCLPTPSAATAPHPTRKNPVSGAVRAKKAQHAEESRQTRTPTLQALFGQPATANAHSTG